MNISKNLMIGVLAVVVAGGAGFTGGMKYQQNLRVEAFAGRDINGIAGRRMIGNGNGRMMGFRPVAGEIIAADDKSITVKLADGSSKIVLVSDLTTISKAADGSREDLKAGEKVAVFGAENSDGSVTAQNIQLNVPTRLDFRP